MNTLLRGLGLLRTALSWTVLAVAWFGLLTPLALLSRLVREDPLRRAWDAEAASYWEPRVDIDQDGLWAFFSARGKVWMLPIVALLLALGLVVVLAESSAVFAFLYPLF